MKTRSKNMMEYDILCAVDELGEIGLFNNSFTDARLHLNNLYPSKPGPGLGDPHQPLTAVLNYLLEERYLYPYFNGLGEELKDGFARGLTPKGLKRLRELRHPVRTWAEANWFPVVVAVITASIGVASILVNLITKSQ